LKTYLEPVPPAYIRLPPTGARDPHTGLTRSALDALTRPQECNQFRPPVKSKILKMAGQKSGVRLIDYQSLKNYLDNLPDVAGAVRDQRKKGAA
jgi:hypothetical protein